MALPARCLIAASLLLGASCSSQNSANSSIAALSTVSAVAVGGALAPIGNVIGVGASQERRLSSPAIYDLGAGRIAIANRTGWFTDKSEFSTSQQSQSAWVIDLKRAPRDHDGLIVLANDNLDRWFFRDHDRATFRLILHDGPLKKVNVTTGERALQASDHRVLTLLLAGESYRFVLSQDPIEMLQPAARQ